MPRTRILANRHLMYRVGQRSRGGHTDKETNTHRQTDRQIGNKDIRMHTNRHAHTTSLARSDTFDTHQQTLLVLDAPRPIQTISQRYLKSQDTSLNHTAWPSCCPEHTYTAQVVVDPKVGFAGGRKDGNKHLQASLQQKTSTRAHNTFLT